MVMPIFKSLRLIDLSVREIDCATADCQSGLRCFGCKERRSFNIKVHKLLWRSGSEGWLLRVGDLGTQTVCCKHTCPQAAAHALCIIRTRYRSVFSKAIFNCTASMQTARQCSTSAQQCRVAQPVAAAPRNCVGRSVRRQQLSRTVAVNAFAPSSHAFSAAAARRISHTPCSSSRRARKLVVRANWGAPVDFSPAKVISNINVAEKLHKVVVDVGELAGGYSKGGQFMQIKVS